MPIRSVNDYVSTSMLISKHAMKGPAMYLYHLIDDIDV